MQRANRLRSGVDLVRPAGEYQDVVKSGGGQQAEGNRGKSRSSKEVEVEEK